MTSYQRAKRYCFWRGSAIALAFFTTWMLLSAYAGQASPITPFTAPLSGGAER